MKCDHLSISYLVAYYSIDYKSLGDNIEVPHLVY